MGWTRRVLARGRAASRLRASDLAAHAGAGDAGRADLPRRHDPRRASLPPRLTPLGRPSACPVEGGTEVPHARFPAARALHGLWPARHGRDVAPAGDAGGPRRAARRRQCGRRGDRRRRRAVRRRPADDRHRRRLLRAVRPGQRRRHRRQRLRPGAGGDHAPSTCWRRVSPASPGTSPHCGHRAGCDGRLGAAGRALRHARPRRAAAAGHRPCRGRLSW